MHLRQRPCDYHPTKRQKDGSWVHSLFSVFAQTSEYHRRVHNYPPSSRPELENHQSSHTFLDKTRRSVGLLFLVVVRDLAGVGRCSTEMSFRRDHPLMVISSRGVLDSLNDGATLGPSSRYRMPGCWRDAIWKS